MLKNGWYFFLPLVIVLGLLFFGYTPEVGAFWGTVSAFALSWFKKETRMMPKDVFLGLANGAKSNCSAGSAIGTLGIIIGGIVLAGLGLKFSAILVEFAGGSLFVATLMVMIISIIIGMGSSTTGSYIILSVVAAPALMTLGVPGVAAHLMVFYAACLSNVTPPVCVSAFAGAAIAGADPIKTGITALKYGTALILLPVGFVYLPEILCYGSTLDIVRVNLTVLIGLVAAAMCLQASDFVNSSISIIHRIIYGVVGAALLLPLSPWIHLIAFGVLLAVWVPSAFKTKSKMARA